jgi:Spy/CpxP family protein refolding chaperone
MKHTKHLSMLIIIVLLSTIAFGQKNQQQGKRPTKEKIKAMKISYITSELDLSSEEAQKFWPIYNEFEDKMDASRKAMRKLHKKEASIDDMTDAEVEEMMNAADNSRQTELNLHKEYQTKFKAVLPIRKVAKLYKAEHSFKKDLLKKMRVKRGGPNELNIPPPPPEH